MTSGRSSGASKRGFASMDEAKQREIASKGGKAAHEKGTAHEFTSEEARAAYVAFFRALKRPGFLERARRWVARLARRRRALD